jgi:hypothetical protein
MLTLLSSPATYVNNMTTLTPLPIGIAATVDFLYFGAAILIGNNE